MGGRLLWSMRSCVNYFFCSQTSLPHGAKGCQTTLLLEQPGGASPAFNATRSQSAQSCNAERPLQREKPSAAFMAGHQLGPKQNKADSDVQKLKRYMALKRAKRELNELMLCAGFASLGTLVTLKA